MEELQPELSKIVKEERARLKMNQDDFAALCEVSKRKIQDAEKGKYISRPIADNILSVLGYGTRVSVEIYKIEK